MKNIPDSLLLAPLTGFPPVADCRVELLILGSFPSPASLGAGQYYGHRQNQFWKLLGSVLNEPLETLPYPERLKKVLARHIGIWDVYRSCIRPGALDADIRNGRVNDFSALFSQTPALSRICFNGRTAERFLNHVKTEGRRQELCLETCLLPSSSPAHTLPFVAKLERWRVLIPLFQGKHLT